MKNTIYYIAGAGRSGSTLLDIALGNFENTHSLGELIFFVKNGIIDDEYCSCGKRVSNCDFWSGVIDLWNSERTLSIKDYYHIQRELTRNIKTLSNIYFFYFPKKRHKQFYKDQVALYKILFKKTEKNILIDSSKNAQNILILRKLPFQLKVLHLKRKFSGVLNSSKKEMKKNPEIGLETDLVPMNFYYVLSIWIVDNFLSFLYSRGLAYKLIKYENLTEQPLETIKYIKDLSQKEQQLFRNRGPLKAHHLVAGNKMRMGNNIYIKTPKHEKWVNNVKDWQKKVSKFIDYLF